MVQFPICHGVLAITVINLSGSLIKRKLGIKRPMHIARYRDSSPSLNRQGALVLPRSLFYLYFYLGFPKIQRSFEA